jgi:hypothetical protein
MTAVLIFTFAAQVLIAIGLTAVLAVRLVLPDSPRQPVARWWRRCLVAAMAPPPGSPEDWRFA